MLLGKSVQTSAECNQHSSCYNLLAALCELKGVTGVNLTIVRAVREHHVITFQYAGLARRVEPFIYGVNTAGHQAISGYQTAGLSRSGDRRGWRMYLLSDIRNLVVENETFKSTRPDYNPNDSRMNEIFARA